MIGQSDATAVFSAMIAPVAMAAGYTATGYVGRARHSPAVQWEKRANEDFVLRIDLQRGKTGRFYYLNLNLYVQVNESKRRSKMRKAVLFGRLEELLPAPIQSVYRGMLDCDSSRGRDERERCVAENLRTYGLPTLERLANYEVIVESYFRDCVLVEGKSFGFLQPDAEPFLQPIAGTYMPVLDVPVMGDHSARLTDNSFRQGRVALLNVWSVESETSRMSHASLMNLSARNIVDIYGIADRNAPHEVEIFLETFGNPYRECGMDIDGTGCRTPCGDLSIDWRRDWCEGNMPLLMVIDGNGIERKLLCGEITEEVIQREVLPAIDEARKPYDYVPKRARTLRNTNSET